MQLAVGVIWYLGFLLISDLSRYNPGSPPGPGFQGKSTKGTFYPQFFVPGFLFCVHLPSSGSQVTSLGPRFL